MRNKTTIPVVAKKSYKDGHVALGIVLKCSGYSSDRARIEGNAEITSIQARELAASLIECADKADSKVAAKAAAKERRNKWHEREIASGRMKVIKW